jgi:DNA-binding XRE family transcriptional regulator
LALGPTAQPHLAAVCSVKDGGQANGYLGGDIVTVVGLLAQARHAAGLSQGELARRAHTSRPTLSAYEHGRKSPTPATAA